MKQLQTISLNGGNNPTASYPDVTASLGDFLSHFTHRKLFWNSSSWQQNYRKPALTFPRSLHFATSFPSPFLGLFYSLLSPCSGFHCGFFCACEVLHAKPGAAPKLSLCRVGAPQSHAHTSSTTWSQTQLSDYFLLSSSPANSFLFYFCPDHCVCAGGGACGAIQHLCVHSISLGLSF